MLLEIIFEVFLLILFISETKIGEKKRKKRGKKTSQGKTITARQAVIVFSTFRKQKSWRKNKTKQKIATRHV